jgi:hypothetical protein
VLAAALVTAAGGCGAGSGSAGPSAGRTGTVGAAGQASAPAAARSRSRPAAGAQLKGVLPAQASLPPGWVLSNGTGQEIDSGTALTTPPYLPVLPRQSCASWKGVDADFLLAGDQASAAQLSVTVGHG